MKMIGWIIMKTHHLLTLPPVEPEPEILHLYNSKSPSGPNVKRKNVDSRRRCGDENPNYWRKSRRNRENWRVWSKKRERYVLLRFKKFTIRRNFFVKMLEVIIIEWILDSFSKWIKNMNLGPKIINSSQNYYFSIFGAKDFSV